MQIGEMKSAGKVSAEGHTVKIDSVNVMFSP